MTATLLLVLHVAVVGGLVARVLLRPRRDPASRIAWILFIAGLPVIGSIAYVLLGEVRPGRGAIETSNAALAARRARAEEREPPPGPSSGTSAIPHAWRAAFDAARSISGFEPVGGNAARLLPDSNATIASMVADIDAATDHVHVLFYIWLPDGNGTRMSEALVRAARRGVTCRAIVDDLGSRSFVRSEHWRAMGRAGVQLARALPLGLLLRRVLEGRLDVRNHRKIVVIDHRVTYCGSQNCADPEFLPKAKYGPWVDAVVRFEGPVARQNQSLFLQDWAVHAVGFGGAQGADGVDESIDGLIDELLGGPPPERAGEVVAQVLGTGPDIRYSAMPELFGTLMHAARAELVVTTPYYVPDESMQAALCAAARRGVATSIVFPARSDSPFVAAASRSFYAELLGAGVRIHEFGDGLLHAKTLTVDGEVSLIGSANMDRRSFDLNFENNVLLHDPALTRDIRARQDDYIVASAPVTSEAVEGWCWHRRLRYNLAAILGPVL